MKHYLIYQIRNNLNGKIYIGKHETFNVDDDYFGSGKYLKRAIKKYGLENFTKTILIDLKNAEEMNFLERIVVTPEFCAREDVYNINVGGDGGWHFNNTLLHHNNLHNHRHTGFIMRDENGHNAGNRKILSYSKEEFEKYCTKISDSVKSTIKKNGFWWNGKKHSTETKQKLSDKAKVRCGQMNNQYGTMWICNDKTHESKKILKTDDIPVGWRKGRFCK